MIKKALGASILLTTLTSIGGIASLTFPTGDVLLFATVSSAIFILLTAGVILISE